MSSVWKTVASPMSWTSDQGLGLSSCRTRWTGPTLPTARRLRSVPDERHGGRHFGRTGGVPFTRFVRSDRPRAQQLVRLSRTRPGGVHQVPGRRVLRHRVELPTASRRAQARHWPIDRLPTVSGSATGRQQNSPSASDHVTGGPAAGGEPRTPGRRRGGSIPARRLPAWSSLSSPHAIPVHRLPFLVTIARTSSRAASGPISRWADSTQPKTRRGPRPCRRPGPRPRASRVRRPAAGRAVVAASAAG